MWRQCASNKQMVLYMIDTKKNVLVMEKWTMDQLSFFFLEKKIGPGIWREMQLKHA